MKSFLLVPILLLALSQLVAAQTKLAFVVGVERYENSGLKNLEYAEDDAKEVKEILETLGFRVSSVIGDEANLKKINSSLDSFVAQTKGLTKSDIVVVYFSGLGVDKLVKRKNPDGKPIEVEEPFFCPNDALIRETSSLLSMNTLLKQLDDYSGSDHNIILLDTCRESFDRGGKGIIDGRRIQELSSKFALFFGAESGRRSFESSELKHGIFTHYLLEGLRGKAANEDDEVTFLGLANYVTKQVEFKSPDLLGLPAAEAQLPNLMANLSGTVILGRVNQNKTSKTP